LGCFSDDEPGQFLLPEAPEALYFSLNWSSAAPLHTMYL
jgi:hypothetical protein